MLQVAVHWLCLNPGWRHTFSVRHLTSATSSVRQRHWSLFSTYWRFTSQIIIIIIIINLTLLQARKNLPTGDPWCRICYAWGRQLLGCRRLSLRRCSSCCCRDLWAPNGRSGQMAYTVKYSALRKLKILPYALCALWLTWAAACTGTEKVGGCEIFLFPSPTDTADFRQFLQAAVSFRQRKIWVLKILI